jgi:transposase
MPFASRRAPLVLAPDVREELKRLSSSRTESRSKVERAGMLIAYADGQSVSAIARAFGTNRPKVERCLSKALEFGARAALRDLPRPGKPRDITPEARVWLVALACQRPVELGYPEETWTTRRLATHARAHGPKQGHPSLVRLGRGTVSKILRAQPVRPHKISYYLERRDPEFDRKMAEVLCVYREVALLREKATGSDPKMVAILSYDEKPGIQAIENTARDLPPVPGKHPNRGRDYEYRRHGTVSLMAGIDLLSGKVWAQVRNRHRSKEFVEFLKLLDERYPPVLTLRIILDNHSAHVSRETRAYLDTRPGRFEFTFTPKHGSWLNLVESFFAKLTKTFLRGMRVQSKQELIDRMLRFLDELNEDPVVFRWKYKLDDGASGHAAV